MDTIKLRKLTLKSVWDVTVKYRNWTVADILKFHPSTLYYAYCCFEKVSFTDDVLKSIETRFQVTYKAINKPGIDRVQWELFVCGGYSYKSMTLDQLRDLLRGKHARGERVPAMLHEEFKRKKYLSKTLDKDRHVYSKQALMGKNHGRKLH